MWEAAAAAAAVASWLAGTSGTCCRAQVLVSVSGLALEGGYEASSRCGGTLVVDDEVTLRSPGQPKKDGKKEECRWKLAAKVPNAILEVECPTFDLQISRNCRNVQLLMVQDNKKPKRFCGQGPKKFTADSGELEVVFRGNRRVPEDGFECTVRSLYDDTTFYGTFGSTEATTATTTKATTKAPTQPGGSGKCECGVPNLTRIVNGVTVNPAHKYPWHVGIKTNTDAGYYCGGTIINNKYALTAAHCFFTNTGERESDEGLVVGVADHNMVSTTDDVSGVTRMVKVKKVIIHPSYDTKTNDNDVALLLLQDTLDLSKNKQLRAVCLPKDDSKTYQGMTGIATGWGRLVTGGGQPDKLQEVDLPILDPKCMDFNVTERMLCAADANGKKDTCQGDSGGPLYVKEGSKFVQVGITSFGFGNCAEAGAPGVYARVSKFLSWIKTNTADATYCQ